MYRRRVYHGAGGRIQHARPGGGLVIGSFGFGEVLRVLPRGGPKRRTFCGTSPSVGLLAPPLGREPLHVRARDEPVW